nr:acyltransferase [Chthoniobacterales bacterium]
MVKKLLMLLSLVLPWKLRRALLEKQFGFTIHPTSRIGLAWVFPERLVLEAHSSIGHLTVCKSLALLHLREHALIGRGNWITGFPLGPSPHFAEETDRHPELIVGEHSAITHRHLIDCTNRITIGKFTTLAGFQSQMMTHSIDLEQN